MKLILTVFFLLHLGHSFGQINVYFPTERMIIQRSNNNTGVIKIAGSYDVAFDIIQAKVDPRAPGQGTATNWETIAIKDDKPYFKGNITVAGGWYSLTVRALSNGNVVASDVVDRVGVGEVFAIAGQSNATGYAAGQGPGANDDRANVLNFSSKENDYNALPIGFSQMVNPGSGFLSLGPSQYAAWNWGNLADLLISNLNVPVLFYGTAYAGTRVKWWDESAHNLPLTNPQPAIKETKHQPYGGLRSVLQYYSSLTGLRAVLWHQGEADEATDSLEYVQTLQSLIAQSRVDIEAPTLPWMIAKVSVTNNTPHSNVRWAQEQVVAADANAFEGPDTDVLIGQDYRGDGVHLDKQLAMTEHANLWRDKILYTNFLSNSTPVLPLDFVDVNLSCLSNGQLQLSSANSFNTYAWSNRDNTDAEATGYTYDDFNNFTMLPPAGYYRKNWTFSATQNITSGIGMFQLQAIKTSGKRAFSPPLNLQNAVYPPTPSISGVTTLYKQEPSVLSGAGCSSYQWGEGQLTSNISIQPSSDITYTLKCKNLYCSSDPASHFIHVSDCYFGDLQLSGPSNGNSYKSQLELSSTQQIANAQNLYYISPKDVILQPGFQAASGSVFRAEIGGCN